ncbi:MAG: hypothetical protein WCK42_03055, partial [Myxococcaceae bacterium]
APASKGGTGPAKPAANATVIEIKATLRFIGSSPVRYSSFYGQGEFKITRLFNRQSDYSPIFYFWQAYFLSQST